MQHMHGNISYMFDYWANPVVHLLLVKTSLCCDQHDQKKIAKCL